LNIPALAARRRTKTQESHGEKTGRTEFLAIVTTRADQEKTTPKPKRRKKTSEENISSRDRRLHLKKPRRLDDGEINQKKAKSEIIN